MSLSNHGKNTFQCEVTNITIHGFYVLIDDKEYFISFEEYPDFKKSIVSDIYSVRLLPPDQLRWDNLDIDIDLEALEEPEKFPLKYSS